VLKWTAENLLQPDGPRAGYPWKFTKEQTRFILNWYAIDEAGRFKYRYGMFRRMKGHGKDPLAAVLCAIEFVGPCRFGGFEDGRPVAISHPTAWVQVAAVSKDQTRNTMTLFPGLFSPETIQAHQIDVGKEIIYAEKGRRRIEAVTSSPRALEGGRATFIIKNETHHWRQVDEGHEMSKVIARNAAKSRDASSRVLAISNAHAPGEDSDAEHDYEAWKKAEQGSKPIDMLYDSLEAPETDLNDPESIKRGIAAARGDSDWLDIDRLTAEIMDPRTTPAMARRFYLNQIVAEEDKPFDFKKWTALERKGYKVADGALIALGFDGSLTRDHTALVGQELQTGHLFVVGYWEPEEYRGELRIPFGEVDETLDAAFERWNVWRVHVDPFQWIDPIRRWQEKYSEDVVVDWPTNQRRKMAIACRHFRDAINTAQVSHAGDKRLTACVANAVKHMHEFEDDDGNQMWTIQKERQDSPLKIDGVVAAILANEARLTAIAEGVLNEGESEGFFV
jgi:hypothetical protein